MAEEVMFAWLKKIISVACHVFLESGRVSISSIILLCFFKS